MQSASASIKRFRRWRVTFFAAAKKVTKESSFSPINAQSPNRFPRRFSDSPSMARLKTAPIHGRRPYGVLHAQVADVNLQKHELQLCCLLLPLKINRTRLAATPGGRRAGARRFPSPSRGRRGRKMPIRIVFRCVSLLREKRPFFGDFLWALSKKVTRLRRKRLIFE